MDPYQLPPSTVQLTRRRWDAYFLAAAILVAMGGLVAWLVIANTELAGRCLLAGGALVLFWLALRLATPRTGLSYRTIAASPGVTPMLGWLALWVIGCTAGVLACSYIGRPQWSAIVVAMGVPILLAGVWKIERRYGRNGSRRTRR